MRGKKSARYFWYRELQTAFAAGMWIVSAASVSQAGEIQPPIEILKYSEPESAPEQLENPPAVFMRGKVPYALVSWEISEGELPGRMQYKESEVVYEKTSMSTEIPEMAEISIEGEEERFSVPLVRREYINERWEDDFSCTLTFHTCQADMYELGGIEISADPDSAYPPLQGYERELLEAAGLPEEYYRITGYEWAGELYHDDEGILCRDALARGERMVRDCRAVYGGEVVLPPRKIYWTKAVYCLKNRGTETGSGVNQGREENQQNENTESAQIGKAKQVIKQVISFTVRLGLLLLLLFLLRFLLQAGRAVWKHWGTGSR